jgi:hypothetical protein
MAFAAMPAAAECKAVEGNYILNLSGFGGAQSFYPVAMIGNITVTKEGTVTGNYKLHVPFQTGTMANRNITGKVSVSKCVGTLKVDVDGRTIHTFTAIVNEEGGIALATGEVGLVVSGTATK